MKTAVFNILGDISGSIFVDLFAGTGQMGIEAEKRGAQVIFVEKNKNLAKIIKTKARGRVITCDAVKALKSLKYKPNIIFADPPYSFTEYQNLIKESLSKLDENGLFILEHHKNLWFDAPKRRKYGDTVLSIWRKDDEKGSISRNL